MRAFVAPKSVCIRPLPWSAIGILAGVVLAMCTSGPVAAQAPGAIPDLSSSISQAWTPLARDGRIARYGTGWFDPPAGPGHGPIKPDPDHPYTSNAEAARTGKPPTKRIGNYKDPVLKPWAAAQMKASNDEALSNEMKIPFAAQARCYPGGVPGQLLFPFEPMYIIQTPKIVYMMWQRDQWVRRIFLTDRHSDEVKPSWYGESIGRYENGELVVDTIGLAAHPLGVLDMFRTPHTEKLHVVERFKVTADNKFLEALIKIEDEGTFNEPWYATKRWKRDPYDWRETICAEELRVPSSPI